MAVNEEQPPWELATKAHSELYMARYRAKTQEGQNNLANAEHRAFAREVVGDNPLMAAPVAAGAIVYQAGKATGIIKGRSESSLDQVVEGFKGIGEGLANSIRKLFPWEEAKEAAKNPYKPKEKPEIKTPIPEVLKKPLLKESDMKTALTMTPEEIVRDEARSKSPASIKELLEEIARTKDPKAKKILEDFYNKMKGGK